MVSCSVNSVFFPVATQPAFQDYAVSESSIFLNPVSIVVMHECR
jgi:hypothetical protein